MRKRVNQVRARRGFTYIDLIVVLILLVLAISFLLPSLSTPRERSDRVKCASNLKQIGTAMMLYAADGSTYPRVRYASTQPSPTDAPTPGSGCDAANAFEPGGVRVNDVTAAMFLLVRNCDLSTEVFVCPSSAQEKDTMRLQSPLSRSNFTDPLNNVSYSIANPYSSQQAASRGYKWSSNVSAEWAIAADRNDGTSNYAADSTSPAKIQRAMNSGNHAGDGQNVLFNDGHVDWFTTAWAGHNSDNIYTRAAVVNAAGATGWTQKAPAQSDPNNFPDPAYDLDTVLLPVFPATARPSVFSPMPWILIGVPFLAIVIVAALVIRQSQKRRALASAEPAMATAVAMPGTSVPPPLPMTVPDRNAKWFYCAAGQTVGPCTFDQLVELARRRMFTASDMVCTETNQQWIPAAKVRGLFSEEGA